MTRVYELFLPPQDPLLKLILSILGCNFCSPTTVSVPVTEPWKETSELNCFFFSKKRHYLLKEHCRDRDKLSHHQRFPPAFRSSSIRGGHMQGKGHLTCHAALQLPRS
ncbi:uncharacterized [Lates japonicus]